MHHKPSKKGMIGADSIRAEAKGIYYTLQLPTAGTYAKVYRKVKRLTMVPKIQSQRLQVLPPLRMSNVYV